jgi:hypothetical protein
LASQGIWGGGLLLEEAVVDAEKNFYVIDILVNDYEIYDATCHM